MAEQAEFDLIKKYFSPDNWRNDVRLGVGDDCALLEAPTTRNLAMTVDTLVSGVHFPVDTSPSDIAYKAVAVNLSDLAAMGAEPAWATLALTLPAVDKEWLQEFSDSFKKTLRDYNVQLVGGDTTQGPLTVTVQATGFVDSQYVMRRDGAKPGDLIFITGTLGDAALGLKLLSLDVPVAQVIFDFCLNRLNRPEPRIDFAQAAAKYCSCAIDVSDGLIADLGHVISSSQCGADIYLDKLPLSNELRQYFSTGIDNNGEIDWPMILAGGDDYELCIMVDKSQVNSVEQFAESINLSLTCIGEVSAVNGLRIIDARNELYVLERHGYQHFI